MGEGAPAPAAPGDRLAATPAPPLGAFGPLPVLRGGSKPNTEPVLTQTGKGCGEAGDGTRLFPSRGHRGRKRSRGVWTCLGHRGAIGRGSLPASRGSPALGRQCRSSGSLPVTRCHQQQLLQVAEVGGGQTRPPRRARPSPGRECFAPGALLRDLRTDRGGRSEGQELCPALGWSQPLLELQFIPEAHGASGCVSRSLQDPFSKRLGLAGSLIDCLID